MRKVKKETESGPMALLGKLSASGLFLIGVIYVMGYVVVNGYQTKYMNYGANALQLKHLAAGLLYTFLTSFQVLVVAFFLLSKLIDLRFPSNSEPIKEAEKKHWFQRLFDRAISIARYVWAIGGGLVLAYFLIFFFFQFVGFRSPATAFGGFSVLKAILPWMGINLLLSLILVAGLYQVGIKSSERALAGDAEKQRAGSKQASNEKEKPTTFEIDQLKRQFVEALASSVVAPLFALVLLLFSLVSFQELYGRLTPDYGGGALYRVAIHLKSLSGSVQLPAASSSPSTSTPSPSPSSGSVSADWRESIKSKDSLLLLVDKDATFIYVLRVDRNGNKQLLEISSGEVEAVEVLGDPPISPADARFFIQ